MGFRWAAISAATVLLAGIFLAPSYPVLYLPFAKFCHQLPERSFQIAAGQTAVCARCLGLYGGALAGMLAPARLPLRFVALAAGMNVLDLIGQWAGGPLRFALAFIFVWAAVSNCWRLASAEVRAGN